MPVKSKAQQVYLAIHEPKVLRKWKAEGVKTSPKGLPYKVGSDVEKVKVRLPKGY